MARDGKMKPYRIPYGDNCVFENGDYCRFAVETSTDNYACAIRMKILYIREATGKLGKCASCKNDYRT